MLYCTALRVVKVFALIWDDIDFYNKTISINKNILNKNQEGGRHEVITDIIRTRISRSQGQTEDSGRTGGSG